MNRLTPSVLFGRLLISCLFGWLCLFLWETCLSLVSALPEGVGNNSEELHKGYVTEYLFYITTVSYALADSLYKTNYAKAGARDPQLTPGTHNLRESLARAITILGWGDITPSLNLEDLLEAIVQRHPATIEITQEQQLFLARLLRVHHLKAAKDHEANLQLVQKITDCTDDDRDDLNFFHDTVRRFFPSQDDDTSATWLETKLKDLTDYSMFTQLFTLTGSAATELRTPARLYEAIRLWNIRRLKEIVDLVPESIRSDNNPTIDQDIQQSFANLKTFLRNSLSHMSVDPKTPDMSQYIAVKDLVDLFGPKARGPNNLPLDATNILQQLKQAVETFQTDADTLCSHPRELSELLFENDTTPWSASLDEVHRLLEEDKDPNRMSGIQLTLPEKETTLETKKLKDLLDADTYWPWRQHTILVAGTTNVSLTRILPSILNIFAVIKGERSEVVLAESDPDSIEKKLVKGTWKESMEATIALFDSHFLPTRYYFDLVAAWKALHPTPQLWGDAYVSRYRKIFETLNQVAKAKGHQPKSEEQAIEQLMSKLPARVREDIIDEDPQYADKAYLTVLHAIQRKWIHLKNRGDLDQPRTKAAPAPTPTPTGSPAPRTAKCGNRRLADDPSVPAQARGPLYWPKRDNNDQTQRIAISMRNLYARENDLCEHCRQTKAVHTWKNAQFKAVSPIRGTPAMPALPAPPSDNSSVVSVD